MDVDGPCAAPQGSIINQNMADPLATVGLFLIAVSEFLALIYFTTGINNRQGGCLFIISQAF